MNEGQHITLKSYDPRVGKRQRKIWIDAWDSKGDEAFSLKIEKEHLKENFRLRLVPEHTKAKIPIKFQFCKISIDRNVILDQSLPNFKQQPFYEKY